ncbi:MAG: thiamine phosphate synthase [Proteobacteria bacterium]|jgi:thiamine-phosphate pyrophosphorylase|nr:thiamine phosphate synthase [Pseudomonadota bacterium]
MKQEVTGLYAITDQVLLSGERFGPAVQAVLAGGARVVQYRDKSVDDECRLAQANLVVGACRATGAVSIINDDVELARKVGADGVHLGRADLSIAEARQVLGQSAILGVSCYNQLELARAAVSEGADYVAVGSLYPSATKPEAVVASIDDLREIANEMTVPVVVIGGITPGNLFELYTAGANAVAVVSAVFGAGPGKQITEESVQQKALLFSKEWSRCEQV